MLPIKWNIKVSTRGEGRGESRLGVSKGIWDEQHFQGSISDSHSSLAVLSTVTALVKCGLYWFIFISVHLFSWGQRYLFDDNPGWMERILFFASFPSLYTSFTPSPFSHLRAEGNLCTGWNKTHLIMKSMAKACGHQCSLNEISVPETH